MKRKPQIIYFSIAMPLLVLLLAVINLFSKGLIYSQTFLLSENIFSKGELWRLITFPFTFNNISELFLLLAVFPFLSYRIERIIKTRFYGIFILLISWFFGFGILGLFNQLKISISGFEMVSCMVLFFYTFYKPREQMYKSIPNIKVWMYSTVILSFWIVLNMFLLKRFGVESLIVPGSSLVIGGSIGLLAFIKVKARKIRQNREMLALKSASSEHINKFLEMAYINEKRASGYANSDFEPNHSLLRNSESENEEMLNIILDKMNLYGKEGLNPLEIKFLNELSKHLD